MIDRITELFVANILANTISHLLQTLEPVLPLETGEKFHQVGAEQIIEWA